MCDDFVVTCLQFSRMHNNDYDSAETTEYMCLIVHRYIGRFYGSAYYGSGSGRILLDDVQCRGTETDIAMCPRRNWREYGCSHSEDVSVSCNVSVPCKNTKNIVNFVDTPRSSNCCA